MDLAQKKCVACSSTQAPLNRNGAGALLKHVKGWTLSGDVRWISKEFAFENFKDGMVFANKITDIAEAEGHHPDLCISWGKVVVEITTHAIRGLSENDFILAAKIDTIAS